MTPDMSCAQWRKSSHSDEHGGACVEVAVVAPVVAIRDSKNPDGPKLLVDRVAFAAFAGTIRADGHDL
ncbi:DUF397 domain-containing protein [Thermomonospora umbrina]|uniref:Uncharacterized protein DUF397 n=1 Tax=Thermomonospora umbrina TaxID=111806 RepID=A0A3D9SYZ4_9ACTN|nr:DUF397 domain-containing protein [Thermomonospora umbrina]REE97794.1 uncharacterized protein DUF397 [Thermomonospora umbrina]